ASTLKLTLDVAAGASPPGTNLAAGKTIAEGGTVTITLPSPLDLTKTPVNAVAEIRDHAGHVTRIERLYRRVFSNGDANADGNVDVLDVFVLINYLFAAGPVPPGP